MQQSGLAGTAAAEHLLVLVLVGKAAGQASLLLRGTEQAGRLATHLVSGKSRLLFC